MNSEDISYEMNRYFNLLLNVLIDKSLKMKGERKEGLNEAILIIEKMLKEFEKNI